MFSLNSFLFIPSMIHAEETRSDERSEGESRKSEKFGQPVRDFSYFKAIN